MARLQLYIAVLISALSLVACSDIENLLGLQKVKRQFAQDQIKPSTWQAPDSARVELPIRISGSHFFVPVSINGVSGFEFLIATTHPHQMLLLDSEKTRALNLPVDFSFADNVLGNRTLSNFFVSKGADLQIGPLLFEDVALVIGKAKSIWSLQDEKEARYDGILGVSILREIAAGISIENQTITFAKSVSDLSTDGYSRVDVSMNHGIPLVPVTIKQKGLPEFKTQFVWSTGYGSGELAVYSTIDARVRLPEKHLVELAPASQQKITMARLDQLSFGGFSFVDPVMMFIDADQEQLFPSGGAISAKLINRFDHIYDLSNQHIYLKPNQTFAMPFGYDKTGLVVNKMKEGNFIVYGVNPDSPASRVQVNKGDQITAINDIPAAKVSLHHYETLASTSQFLKITVNGANSYHLVLKDRL